MKATILHITHHSIRIFLMLFWLYVAMDKIWDLPQFHHSLLQQPFPEWWADILVWFLPVTELTIAILFVPRGNSAFTSGKFLRYSAFLWNPYFLSAVLLFIFSIYIALGVLDVYTERPCGCASALSSLSWTWHLVLNIFLLLLSLMGWYLYHKSSKAVPSRYKWRKAIRLFLSHIVVDVVCFLVYIITVVKMFKMRFALFPGRPVRR